MPRCVAWADPRAVNVVLHRFNNEIPFTAYGTDTMFLACPWPLTLCYRFSNDEHSPVQWRLLDAGISGKIPLPDQRAILELAFRMWSEVIPLRFSERNMLDIRSMDVIIAFAKRKRDSRFFSLFFSGSRRIFGVFQIFFKTSTYIYKYLSTRLDCRRCRVHFCGTTWRGNIFARFLLDL